MTLLVTDIKDSGGFIWKDNGDLYNFLKIGLIQTSNLTLINLIREGSLDPRPKEIVKSDHYNVSETKIRKIPINEFIKTQVKDQCFYNHNSTFTIPFTDNVTIFAIPYIDTKELANHYRIDLGSNLAHYFGATTSEVIIENGKVPALTSLFVQSNGKVWPGPVYLTPTAGYVAGSFKTSKNPTRLKQIKVQNIKLADNRTKIYKDKVKRLHRNNTFISNLEYSINDKVVFYKF